MRAARSRSVAALALLSAVCFCTPGAAAPRCSEGKITGSDAPQAAPEDNVKCILLGRIYCRIEEYRGRDVAPNRAVQLTLDWLRRPDLTGAALDGDFAATVDSVAASLYRRDRIAPWTAYYYAVYSCGLDGRIAARGDADLGRRWEAAAQDCLKRFPGEGDGAGNEALRTCLSNALDAIAVRPPLAK